MSRQVSPGSVRQGRSPARSANLRTSSVKNNNKSIVSPVRKTKDDSILIERDQGPKNTPQHLHGLDKAGDIIDDADFFKSYNKESSDSVKKRGLSIKWEWSSWKTSLSLLLSIAVIIQVILWLQSKPDSFQEMNSSGEDATVCLRSYNELRKKLQLAFELITESGKLFKQLERQTKHQHELIETKHNSLEYKAKNEIERLKKQIDAIKESSQQNNVDFSRYSDKEFPVDLSEMHSLIEIALERYDADKIGIPDYALESAGGRIHVPYHSLTHSSGWPIMKVFGIVVWEDTRTPREVIKPENLPGNCWPLQGQKGYVTIKLATRIIPSMITMEHLHQSLARFSDNTLSSMPKNFSVYSWADEHGQQKILLGSYIYNKHGKARQTFPIQMISETAIEYVELRIGSNYGNTDFTCIYRFRVHGDTEGEKKSNPGT